MLSVFTLKNGLKVALFTAPTMRSTYLAVSVKGGSLFDTDEKSGVAHFMEHILVEGTPSFPDVEKLSDYIEKLAGGYNASTSHQTVRFNINGPAKYSEDMVKIASEVFFAPLFNDESIERERRAILSEIKQRQDSLAYKNGDFFDRTRYKKGHPMIRDIGGSVESVEKLQKQDLIDYWKLFFYPANTYLAVVGGFKKEEMEGYIHQYFDPFTSSKKFAGFPNLTNADLSSKTVAIREDQKLQSVYTTISWPSLSDQASLKIRVTQGMIRSILGGLRRSRLYRLLRQKKGLVYHVDVGIETFEHFGLASISSQMAIENVDEVLTLSLQELVKFIKEGPTEEEISFSKNYSINRSLMSFDHPSTIAAWIEDDLVWEDKIYLPEEYVKITESITKEDIMQCIKEYWDLSKVNLVIQGPVKNSAKNNEKYTKILEIIK